MTTAVARSSQASSSASHSDETLQTAGERHHKETRLMIRWTKWISPAVALAMLAACNKGETGTNTKDTTAAGTPVTMQAHDSALTSQNAELQAQTDSLFGATRSLLAAMASIDSATTAAGIESLRSTAVALEQQVDRFRLQSPADSRLIRSPKTSEMHSAASFQPA